MMVKRQYTVSFATPAFLGDAEQNGAWRTPPFKALLRQWWRVVAAKDYDYNCGRLREAEGKLFGNAWLTNEFRQSLVKLKLDDWKNGQLKRWPIPDPTINHPEVTNHVGNPKPIGSNLYLGYGPLIFQNGNTKLKANAAIQEGESAKLHIAYPNSQAMLADVVQLIHWFGTVGGRSRNGWGSLELGGDDIALKPLEQNDRALQAISRPLDQCLRDDWPHAIGKDGKGLLIWITRQDYSHWRDAMKELARTKIAFRTALRFTNPRGQIDRRHTLAYPVTNHSVSAWGSQARLANQLRFKVISRGNRLLGVAYHLPCGTPADMLRRLGNQQNNFRQQQLSVWQDVHAQLDTVMHRIA